MDDYVINNGDLFGRLQKHKNIYSQNCFITVSEETDKDLIDELKGYIKNLNDHFSNCAKQYLREK